MSEWWRTKDGYKAGLELYGRHYSANRYADGRRRTQFVGPGEHIVLRTFDACALFVWRRFIDDSGQRGINCARSEEHTSELQSLMRISYAVFCLKKKKKTSTNNNN